MKELKQINNLRKSAISAGKWFPADFSDERSLISRRLRRSALIFEEKNNKNICENPRDLRDTFSQFAKIRDICRRMVSLPQITLISAGNGVGLRLKF